MVFPFPFVFFATEPLAIKFPVLRILSLLSQLILNMKLSGFVLRPTEKAFSSDCPSSENDSLLIPNDNYEPATSVLNEKFLNTLFFIESWSAFPVM